MDLMWFELRSRRLGGFKFVRECPIGPFFADFACREHKVIVEIDGGTHSTDVEIANDKARESYLIQEGYRVFRVSNGDVYQNLDGVCDALLAYIHGEAD